MDEVVAGYGDEEGYHTVSQSAILTLKVGDIVYIKVGKGRWFTLKIRSLS